MKSLLIILALLFNISAYAQVKQNTQIVLSTKNTVTIRGAIESGSITIAQLQLVDLVIARGSNNYPIYLVLDSPGGSIEDGLAFIDFAKTIKNLKTITFFAASMASAIVQHLPGERLMTQNALQMFHRARGGFSGQIEVGEVETRLATIKKIVLSLEKVNAARMNLSLLDYKAKVANEYWVHAEDSVSLGAADRVIDVSCTVDLITRRDSVTMETMFGAVRMLFSSCPLFRAPISTSELKLPKKGK
jgi:ATP-dependent protease ClpP protease subunit